MNTLSRAEALELGARDPDDITSEEVGALLYTLGHLDAVAQRTLYHHTIAALILKDAVSPRPPDLAAAALEHLADARRLWDLAGWPALDGQ